MSELLLEARWSLAKGDPTFIGSVTVVAYFVAASCCWFAAERLLLTKPQQTMQRGYWLILAILLTILGVNKIFDLLSIVTTFLRNVTWIRGWYDVHHTIQVIGLALLVIMIGLTVVLFHKHHRPQSAERISFLGIVWLASFVVVRAISIHEVDAFINFEFFGIRMNWILELSGLLVMTICAMGILVYQQSSTQRHRYLLR